MHIYYYKYCRSVRCGISDAARSSEKKRVMKKRKYCQRPIDPWWIHHLCVYCSRLATRPSTLPYLVLQPSFNRVFAPRFAFSHAFFCDPRVYSSLNDDDNDRGRDDGMLKNDDGWRN